MMKRVTVPLLAEEREGGKRLRWWCLHTDRGGIAMQGKKLGELS